MSDETTLTPEQQAARVLGKKGGDRCKELHGDRSYYEAIGRKGGTATKERHGEDYYRVMGQRGGQVTAEKYGEEFYQNIGKKGGQRVKALIAAAKAAEKEQGDEA